jgi:NAD(P)-dependent dehydrogenase (short-subunit alcohol dehydrogenase family)
MPLWADFASLDSVHEAVERFRRQFDRLDVLINNCTVEPKGGRAVHALTHDGYSAAIITPVNVWFRLTVTLQLPGTISCFR